jgi:hypothetical protein
MTEKECPLVSWELVACQIVHPENEARLKSFLENSKKPGTSTQQKQWVEQLRKSYQGVILSGKRGEAKKTSCEVPEKIFYSTDADQNLCNLWAGRKTVYIAVQHACCDGDVNAPCLLDSSGAYARAIAFPETLTINSIAEKPDETGLIRVFVNGEMDKARGRHVYLSPSQPNFSFLRRRLQQASVSGRAISALLRPLKNIFDSELIDLLSK